MEAAFAENKAKTQQAFLFAFKKDKYKQNPVDVQYNTIQRIKRV